MNQVLLIILGSVLALMTSVVVEYIRIQITERRFKRLIRGLLKSEVPTILTAIDSLMQETGAFGYIPLARVNEIDTARQGFDRNRDWIILFKDETFRRDLFTFYLDLNGACRDTQFVEGIVANPQYVNNLHWQNYVRTRRTEILNRFGGIVQRGNSLLGRIDVQ